MTLTNLSCILHDVRYRKTRWRCGDMGDGFFIQLRLIADGQEWGCRKWYISSHATTSEVVQTALMAVLAAEEHEAREKFTYRGHAVFGPHFGVDQMANLCQVGLLQIEVRDAVQEQSPATILTCEDGGRRSKSLSGEGVRPGERWDGSPREGSWQAPR